MGTRHGSSFRRRVELLEGTVLGDPFATSRGRATALPRVLLLELFSLGRFEADCATRRRRNRTTGFPDTAIGRPLTQTEELQHASNQTLLWIRSHTTVCCPKMSGLARLALEP